MRIGIVGYGVIGKATASVFPEVVIYDPLKGFPDPGPLGSCEVVFICVPTPTENGRQDVSIVEQSLEWITPVLQRDQVVAVRSTVLPGTTGRLQVRYPHLNIAHNPEFLRSHCAFDDARSPHRVVIGADHPRARRLLFDVYRGSIVTDFERRAVLTDSTTAELIKYAANTYLAMKTSYFNEMFDVCQTFNADFSTLSAALGMDPRISPGEETRVDPGQRGFDDECLPKDLDAFITFLQENGFPATMLQGTREVNQAVRRGPSTRRELEPEA